MAQLTGKELSALQDLLTDEELRVKKFKMLASQAEDREIKERYETIYFGNTSMCRHVYWCCWMRQRGGGGNKIFRACDIGIKQ